MSGLIWEVHVRQAPCELKLLIWYGLVVPDSLVFDCSWIECMEMELTA